MKVLLSILIIVTTSFAWADEKPSAAGPAGDAINGEVLEVKNVESYTYLRLKTKNGEQWAAVSKAPIRKGAIVGIRNVMMMNNFESKTLTRTFPTIAFGTLAGSKQDDLAKNKAISSAHTGNAKSADVGDIQVPKATGPNAWTVAEIITKAGSLKDKSVMVSGKVVKYNPGIMGKNWVHLRDGSGSANDNTNDILVTTQNEVKLGDVVTANGSVRTDKDFGAGYAYKVLIEEATITK